jgi:hypothetical protein
MLRITLLFLFSFFQVNSFSQNTIGKTEALLIREAKLIADTYGDELWKGFGATAFTIILVKDSIEYLIYHPQPSSDFKLLYKDSILNTDVYARSRTYPKEWLATFPAVNGVNCIVVGTPKNTGRTYTNWIVTLLHEHFHQYVNSQPGYFEAVDKLNLSGGDETGMWMLNYPFPYDSAVIINQYQKFTTALAKAVNNIAKKDFKKLLNIYLKEKQVFKKILKPEDYRYFSFQLWNEGLATYTEYKFLEILSGYKFSATITALKDVMPLAQYKKDFFKSQMLNLKELKIQVDKRVCFYPIGFAEGLLLDNATAKWRSMYFIEKFSTDTYFYHLK